jgi:glutaredoxin-related protein
MRQIFDEARIHSAVRPRIEAYQAELLAQVQQLIATHQVVVVGMTMNPFPGRARRLLDEQKVVYEYLGIGSYLGGWRKRLALKLWTGWTTFPMIFVKGSLIGGYQDLQRLVQQGELRALLDGAG